MFQTAIMPQRIILSLLFLVIISCGSNKGSDAGKRILINDQSDFDKHNHSEFQPGTLILFATGAIFNGQFTATGTGTVDNPIKVTAYDQETGEIFWDYIDNKPIINGNGGLTP